MIARIYGFIAFTRWNYSAINYPLAIFYLFEYNPFASSLFVVGGFCSILLYRVASE